LFQVICFLVSHLNLNLNLNPNLSRLSEVSYKEIPQKNLAELVRRPSPKICAVISTVVERSQLQDEICNHRVHGEHGEEKRI